MDEAEITALLSRLSRPHPSGGVVIERAALLASGADFPAIMEWITAHAGTAEAIPVSTRGGGLHGARMTYGDAGRERAPLRFVLPPGALG